MCDDSEDSPFCAPQDGAEFRTGETIEITWSPSFFNSAPLHIFIQADFPSRSGDSTSGEVGQGAAAGFTSDPVDTQSGTYSWAIMESYLPANATSVPVSLFIFEPVQPPLNPPILANHTASSLPLPSQSEHQSNLNQARQAQGSEHPNIRHRGPQILLLRHGAVSNNAANQQTPPLTTPQAAAQDGSIGGPNTLAIALPIAFGMLTLLLMAGYVFVRRGRPGFTARGWLADTVFARSSTRGAPPSATSTPGRRQRWLSRWWWWWQGSGGYGERQSRGQRIKKGGGGGGVRGREIKVVTTDLDGLRMNAVRMAGAFGVREAGAAGRGWADAGGSMNGGGLGPGMGTISSQIRGEANGRGGNVFREEVWRQERERV